MAHTQINQIRISDAGASDTLHMPPLRSYWPTALPIPLLITIIVGFWLADLTTVYELPYLNTLLNLLFTAVIALFVTLLAARSFLMRGDPALLVLGAGVLVWSASGIIAVAFGQNDPNKIVTIHNLCVFLSATCHLGSTLLVGHPPADAKTKYLWLAIAFSLAAALVASITIAAHAGWTPVFFIQGQGGTLLRQVVLVASIAMFVLSAAIMIYPNRGSKPAFAHWYAMALLLIATGIFGILVQPAYSSLVGWAGRISQYIGALYMLFAAVAALRESGIWQVSLETQLNQTRQDYTSLLDLAADGILVFEPQSDGYKGRVLQVNSALCQLLGYGDDELLSMAPVDIVVPEDRPKSFVHASRTMTGNKRRYETSLRSKDGRLVPVEISTHFFDRSDRPRGLSIIRDITERKRTEKALLESEEKFRLIATNIREVIFLQNKELRYVWIFNPAVGLSESSVIGKTDAELLPADEAARITMIKQKVLETGQGTRAEVQLSPGGNTHWYEAVYEPCRNTEGQIIGILSYSRDISERKQAEDALRQLNEDLEKRVAERTALAETRARQLQALAVELIETEERERRRIADLLHEDLQQMIASARFQLQLVKPDPILENVTGILEESIAKSRRLSHELSPPIMHHGSLQSAIEWLAGQMNKQFGLKVQVEAENIPQLKNSPVKVFIFRAVQELLFNIVKHSGVKSACVSFSCKNSHLNVTVSDQGKGFDSEDLFSNKINKGFGLISIRERVRYIGGQFKIESKPDQGSRFILKLPIQPVTEEGVQIVSEPQVFAASQKAASYTGLRVLFADDHKVMRQGLVRLISGQPDIQVVGEAANGREAVELARQLRPDVIVMDISMPEMDGIEATRRIKAELPEVRIIGLSMFEDEQSTRNMLGANADAFIAKTASSAELLKAIYRTE